MAAYQMIVIDDPWHPDLTIVWPQPRYFGVVKPDPEQLSVWYRLQFKATVM
jgi:hypothetical protein